MSSHERRGYPRGYVAAVATVFMGEERVGEYALRDLSAGGALLIDGPLLKVSTEYRILMEMPGLGSLRLNAIAVHAGKDADGEHTVGVKFTALSPQVEEGLQELVRQELERATMPSVLVADGDLRWLSRVAEELAAIGERPMLALKPLEVVQWLSDPEVTVEVVLVGSTLKTRSGASLATFIREEFPEMRCFVLDRSLDHEGLTELLDAVSCASRDPRGRHNPRPSYSLM